MIEFPNEGFTKLDDLTPVKFAKAMAIIKIINKNCPHCGLIIGAEGNVLSVACKPYIRFWKWADNNWVEDKDVWNWEYYSKTYNIKDITKEQVDDWLRVRGYERFINE